MNYSRIFSGRLFWALISLIMILAAVWLFRFPLLRATGNFLISSDPLITTDAIYVLGGASLDRGLAAAQLLDQGIAPVAYCLGELVPQSLEGEGLDIPEGQLIANVMIRAGSDPAHVNVIREGTSTWEESEAILASALQAGYDTIVVVTTDFHSRRVGMVFNKRFRKEGIKVLVHGAPSSEYDSQRWWESEQGLMMVNNEYVKLAYYWLKY